MGGGEAGDVLQHVSQLDAEEDPLGGTATVGGGERRPCEMVAAANKAKRALMASTAAPPRDEDSDNE